MNRQFVRARHSFSQLQSILSKMKVATERKFPKEITNMGNSDLFNYATNKQYEARELQDNELKIWKKLVDHQNHVTKFRVPMNGFEEAMQMTEEGRLWKYPIDNECGMEAEKQVPFEEHVCLEKHLEDFPKNESIQAFMGLVVSGLARNYWMTAERKREVIKFYKDYFESHRDIYKQSGFDM